VCQKLGIVPQEGEAGNGLDKTVMIMLSFIENVAALDMMLDHAAQLFQAGDELVAKVILERRLGACFEPGTPRGRHSHQLACFLGGLFVFIGMSASPLARFRFEQDEHRKQPENEGNDGNCCADSTQIASCRPL
jgi:hypothetical protein